MADPTFAANEIDTTVARLGVLVGVLDGTPDEGSLTFKEEWFTDPLSNIESIPKNKAQSDQLIKLLEELLGTVSGDALGSPKKTENRTWYPISLPTTPAKPTGLYLITEDVPVSNGVNTAHTVVGLGTVHEYDAAGVAVRPYIYVPILEMPTQNGVFVLGGKDHPIEVGVEVTNSSGIFGTDEVSFTGVKAFATVDFSGSAPDLDIVVTNLKLPGEPAQDRSLADLENISTDEWISTAVYLLISQIAKAAPQAEAQKWTNMANAVASILGLIGSIPSVDWEGLVTSPSKAGTLLSNWLKSIASDPKILAQWLADWYVLFSGVSPELAKGKVKGSGSRQDPWVVPLLTAETGKIDLSLTVAAVVDAKTKDLQVYPGVRLASDPIVPISAIADVTVQIQASTEIIQLTLPASGTPPKPELFPSFQVASVLNNPTAAFSGGTAFEDVSETGISIGAIVVGMAYREPSGGDARAVYPYFALLRVNTPIGSWDQIDLLNLNEVVKDAEEALVNLIQKVLDAFFDTAGGTAAGKISQSMATLLGLIAPPKLPAGQDWPVTDLLLTGNGVEAVIKNPTSALGSYYTRCLTTKNKQGNTAWSLLMPYVASLFGEEAIEGSLATGAGTYQDPWRVSLFTAGDGSKALNAYVDTWIAEAATGSSGPAIRLALTLEADLKVTSATPSFALSAELLDLGLPAADGSGSVSAFWLPGVTAALKVAGATKGQATEPLATPTVAGISIQADSIQALFGWDRGVQLYSQLAIAQVELLSGGVVVENLGDLEFSISPTQWNTDDLSKFTQLIADCVGLWLLVSGGRCGVAVTSGLGLLPNLSEVLDGAANQPFKLPKGLSLPNNWPTLDVTDGTGGSFLSDPWPAVRTQIEALLGNAAFAEPYMRLLGWSITGTLPNVPDPLPAGTRADPWWVEFEPFWQLRPLLWTEASTMDLGAGAMMVGTGLARQMVSANAAGVQLDVMLRADIGEFQVDTTAQVASSGSIPGVGLTAVLAGDSGPLVGPTSSGLEIGSATFGAFLNSAGITPTLVLKKSRLKSTEQLRTIDLATAFASSQGAQIIEQLIFALTVELTAAALQLPVLKAILEALALLKLGLIKDKFGTQSTTLTDGGTFELALGGWRSMLANPTQFLAAQAKATLANPKTASELFTLLAKILGYESFKLPASLSGLPDLLVALDLFEDYDGGVGPKFASWIALVSDPVGYLKGRADVLLDPNNADARKALVTALTKSGVPTTSGPDVALFISNSTSITLQIPANKRPAIGSELELAAQISLNTQSLSLNADATVTSPSYGMGLAFDVGFDFGGPNNAWVEATSGPDWSLALVNGNPALQDLVPPLVFYPLPDATSVASYLAELGERVPIFLASILGARFLNAYVMPDYPVVQRMLSDLGLAVPNAEGGPPQVLSLVPVFSHPIAWLLSEGALGNGQGALDLTKLGTIISDLPDPNGTKGPGGILLTSVTNGMSLAGLPYGVSCTFTCDDQNGVHIRPEIKPTLPSSAPAVDITANLGFGKGAGVNVGGQVGLTFTLPDQGGDPTTLTLDAAYAKTSFTLDVNGNYKGSRFPTSGDIALIPFGGLNQFIDSGAAAALLKYAATQLVELYKAYEQKPDHNKTVVSKVQGIASVLAYFDITDVDSFYDTATDLANDPLTWLMAWFKDPKLAPTLGKLNDLLSNQLGFSGFSVAGDLLIYEPALPRASAALQIQLGEQPGSSTFGVWFDPTMQLYFMEFGISAGLAFASLSKTPALEFDLGAWFGVAPDSIPIPNMKNGPQVRFDLTATLHGVDEADLRVYPLGYGTNHETLLIDLLPTPQFAYGDAPNTPVPAATWLPEFLIYYLIPLVADVVLQTTSVQTWLNVPLIAGKPATAPGGMAVDWGLFEVKAGAYPAGLLASAHMTVSANRFVAPDAQDPAGGTGTEVAVPAELVGDATAYILSDLRQIWSGLSPTQVVEKLFFTILKAFDGLKIVPIKGGGIYIASNAVGDNTDYGLRLQIPDILISGGKAGSKTLTAQLGKWMSHQTDNKSWINQSDSKINPDPGVAFYFLRGKDQDLPSFHASMDLVSIGVDFAGADTKTPLVNLKGFEIGGLEPRIYFSIDQTNPADFSIGAGIQFDRLGFPMGPSLGSGGSNSNPVAESILASGTNSQKPDQTLNPTFSVALGMVSGPGNSFYVDLFADEGTVKDPNGVLWIPIQRAFGPLDIQKIGIGFKEDGSVYVLTIGFDGSVTLAGLSLSLVNLAVGIPVSEPLNFVDYRLALDGMDISYDNGPVEINGGFLKSPSTPIDYTGMAMIEAATFGLSAMGSYSQLDKSTPSLFIFALLDTPLGGPPYFFVTGVAAGFGINRKLILPDQNSVAAYPLVGGVIDPAKYFPAGNDPGGALKAIQQYIPPSRGDYWLAAGIKFTTFELLDSFALLTVAFGTEFKLALLGLSVIELPKGTSAIVRAELQIMVSFSPSEGLLAATATLTRNSYVLDKKCQLTGGFAFYVWFSGDHGGDFVVTLGGYNPDFILPDYYPDEPRLGFNWPVGGGVSIKGGAYMALTSSAVMAGGSLELLYQSGNLKAWFTAVADFLVQWKPFYYSIHIGVSIGASYRVDVLFIHKTFTIELGADLTITGPPLHGTAHVTWFIISFTVTFGDDNTEPPLLKWKEFNESFLPQGTSSVDVTHRLPAPDAAAQEWLLEETTLHRDARCSARVVKGLVSSEMDQQSGESKRWIINPQTFSVETVASVPTTQFSINGVDVSGVGDTDLGILPMGKAKLTSKQNLAITKLDNNGKWVNVPAGTFATSAVLKPAPKSLWCQTAPNGLDGNHTTIPGVSMGLSVTAPEQPYDSVVAIPWDNLTFEKDTPRDFLWGSVTAPTTPTYSQNDALKQEMDTIMKPSVVADRSAILQALIENQLEVDTDVSLNLLSKTANEVFLDAPRLVTLGGYVEAT